MSFLTNLVSSVVRATEEASVKREGKELHKAGGYSLRVHPEMDERGREAAHRDLVALGVLGAEEFVSVVPG